MTDKRRNQRVRCFWDESSEDVGIEPGELRKLRQREVVIRFVFGAATSFASGVVALVFGPEAGGLFLAFPALLAASLTLVESKEGRAAAVSDASGAVLGAVGLVSFSVVCRLLLPGSGVLALVWAMATWSVTAIGLYALVSRVGRLRHKRRTDDA